MNVNAEDNIIVRWINDLIKILQAILIVIGLIAILMSGPIMIWRLVKYFSLSRLTNDRKILAFIRLKYWACASGIYAYMLLAGSIFSSWLGFDDFSDWFQAYWPTFTVLLYGGYGTTRNLLAIFFGDMFLFAAIGLIINSVANSRGQIVIRDDGSMVLGQIFE